MKTWTNPTVEELDVKLTANGTDLFYFETLGEAAEGVTGSGTIGDIVDGIVGGMTGNEDITGEGSWKKEDEKEQS